MPPPHPSTLPSPFLRRTGPCGCQAALRHSVRAEAAHRPGAKPTRSSIPWAARWPSGGQPQDHPSLQISRLRPPDLGVPACFPGPVLAPDSAWAWSLPPSTRTRTPPVRSPTYLMAEVANTCPLEPTQRTTIEATTTMRSGGQSRRHQPGSQTPAQRLAVSATGPRRGRPGPHPRHMPRPPETPPSPGSWAAEGGGHSGCAECDQTPTLPCQQHLGAEDLAADRGAWEVTPLALGSSPSQLEEATLPGGVCDGGLSARFQGTVPSLCLETLGCTF